MPDLTTNHGLQLWAAGETDWEHRNDMQAIERALTVRDLEANLSNYTAYDGARFEATDSNAIYLADGSNWNAITPKPTQDHIDDTANPHSVTASQIGALSTTGGTVSGDLTLDSGARLNLDVNTDLHTTVDSSLSSGDEPTFGINIDDSQSARPNIRWYRGVTASDNTDPAFGIHDVTNSTDLLTVNENGDTTISGTLGVSGTSRSEGAIASGGGFIAEQRGAPTTTELADGERMQYTSDGTDAHSAGDLVSARNSAGTIVSQVIAAASNDA